MIVGIARVATAFATGIRSNKYCSDFSSIFHFLLTFQALSAF